VAPPAGAVGPLAPVDVVGEPLAVPPVEPAPAPLLPPLEVALGLPTSPGPRY